MTTSAVQNLTFQNTSFDIIDREGHPWLQARQIGEALGYKNPSPKIHDLYTRYADEFTPSMTQVLENLEVPNSGISGNLVTRTRIFSLRGCHLLAMFSRTPVAKKFRVWVLDVLEKLQEQDQKDSLPSPTQTLHSMEYFFGDYRIRAFDKDDAIWFAARDVCFAIGRFWEGNKTLQSIPPKHKAGAPHAVPGRFPLLLVSMEGIRILAARSFKPQAQEFMKWVTQVVAPADVPTIDVPAILDTPEEMPEVPDLAPAKRVNFPSRYQSTDPRLQKLHKKSYALANNMADLRIKIRSWSMQITMAALWQRKTTTGILARCDMLEQLASRAAIAMEDARKVMDELGREMIG